MYRVLYRNQWKRNQCLADPLEKYQIFNRCPCRSEQRKTSFRSNEGKRAFGSTLRLLGEGNEMAVWDLSRCRGRNCVLRADKKSEILDLTVFQSYDALAAFMYVSVILDV